MPPKSASGMGVTRAIYSCQRCRSRKIRCDQNFPSCKACKTANAECIGIDAATGGATPRSYVSYLEERVAYLETELRLKGNPVVGFSHGVSPQTAVKPKDEPFENPVNTAGGDITEVSNRVADMTLSYIGPASGISFARLLVTALKSKDKTVHGQPRVYRNTPETISTPLVSSSSLSVPHSQFPPISLPSKQIAETLISLYFSQSNPQLPLVHREMFLKDHFIPIYGPLSGSGGGGGGSTASDNQSSVNRASSKPDTSCLPARVSKSYYFLYMIFAIATTIYHQRYHADTSDAYRLEAMKYSESVYSSADRLEALQGILLLTLYSIMRPTAPGVWYTLSSALRLCVDLGLHTEDSRPLAPPFRSNKDEGNGGGKTDTFLENPGQVYDAFTLDMRRRLFWCTYSLDRQICIYLGRPFGIPEESIKVSLPSCIDDSYITQDNGQISDYSDLEQIRVSNIAHSLTAPSYKSVILSFIKIRQIQAEIQRILYDCADIPREFQTCESWKQSMALRLEIWYNSCPKSKMVMDCDFNTEIFKLNYLQTKLLLFGLSPADLSPSAQAYSIIADAGKNIIKCYEYLNNNLMINYTWVAVHNLFVAGTSYLYSLYSSWDIRSQTPIEEIRRYISSCKNILLSLTDRCYAAVESRGTFEILSAAVLSLVRDEHEEKLKRMKNNLSSQDVKKSILPASVDFNGSYSGNLQDFFKEAAQDEKITQQEAHSRPVMDENSKDEGEESGSSDFGHNKQYMAPIEKVESTKVSFETISRDSSSHVTDAFEKMTSVVTNTIPSSNTTTDGLEIFEMMHGVYQNSIWDEFFVPTNKTS